MKEKHYKVIIIGSGPAGLTAAIYAARADLNPLLIQGYQPGGQLTITTEVENFPGFPKGIQGPELMSRTLQQAERFGVEAEFTEVEAVDFSKRPFILTIEEKEITADTVIIATGAKARLLGLESESHLMGYGVSACATCDGFFFRDKEIVVIGGGDSALEEATFLTKFATKATIIHRRDSLRASKIMQEKGFKNSKVDFIWDSVPEKILGTREEGVTGVELRNVKTGEHRIFETQGVFLAIGHTPNTQVFKGQLEMDDVGYVVTKPDSTRTSVEGVFAAGDVQDTVFRQAITAAGTGCMAALEAEKFLSE